jgi:UDP-glucose/iron transport system ATP-binding protein
LIDEVGSKQRERIEYRPCAHHLDNRVLASAWTGKPSDGETAYPDEGKLILKLRLRKALRVHPIRNVMLTVKALTRLHVSARFELKDGECVALQGPSGVGKSLLLRAIADLDPNEGIVELDGMLRETMPAPQWRKQVTYVVAEPGWWADTVEEHFPVWDHAVPLVKRLGLSPSCRTWNIGRLSSGEKQRLGLVRALMLRSRVLLLDEPTSALDSASTAAVELIVAERISTGTSVIWSTHDRAQAQRVGSRVFIMNSGGRIEEHSP